MSPEQAVSSKHVDERADIYSLGCTLHFLLTGRPVFTASTPIATFAAHVDQPIPSLTAANGAIPSELDAVFCRMVQKDPQQRYQTADEVVNALASVPSEQVDECQPAKDAQVIEASPNASTNILVDDIKLIAGQDKQTSRVDSRRVSRKNKRWNLLAAIAIAAVLGCIAFFIINGQDGDVST
jgi:serine/threonine protein kinase